MAQEEAAVTMSQKCLHLESRVSPPHYDGRGPECELWSQTAKPKSETCHLLTAFSASASLPVEIRVAFPHGTILRIQRKVLAQSLAQGKYSVSGN